MNNFCHGAFILIYYIIPSVNYKGIPIIWDIISTNFGFILEFLRVKPYKLNSLFFYNYLHNNKEVLKEIHEVIMQFSFEKIVISF
jgi:hypothetical protein